MISLPKNYNYFRDYDPAIARYSQSDPIGLLAGTNTYAYAGARSLSLIDRMGLACGSGWNNAIVPDNPFGFGFSPCCQGHDNCYDNDCPNSPIKADCDSRFYRCMTGKCKSLSGAVRWICELSAASYFTAVDKAGAGPYNAARGSRKP